MHIVYDSLTGNVRRFAQGVQALCNQSLCNQALCSTELALDLRHTAPGGDYLLFTYTFGRGEVPPSTAAFLERHSAGLRGVVASGSFHWGEDFARAGQRIAEQYGVPLVARINKSGSAADRQRVADWLAAQPGRSLPLSPALSLPDLRSRRGPLD